MGEEFNVLKVYRISDINDMGKQNNFNREKQDKDKNKEESFLNMLEEQSNNDGENKNRKFRQSMKSNQKMEENIKKTDKDIDRGKFDRTV